MNKPSNTILFSLFAVLLLMGAGCASRPSVSDGLTQQEQEQPAAVTDEEQSFLDSGNAKAIENETDLWQVREDSVNGFSVRYPHDIAFSTVNSTSPYTLTVEIDSVAGLEGTMGYNEKTARTNLAALAEGEYGDSVDFSFGVSEQVRAVGSANAQDFLVLGRFEVCDVTFERKLYLFHNDNQIVLTLSGDRDLLAAAIPDYFTVDADNCGDQEMWIFDRQVDFHDALAAGTAPVIIQDWYNMFDQIVGTIILAERNSDIVLDGRWRAIDDENSAIEFVDGHKLDYHNERIMSDGIYELDGSRLIVDLDGDVFEYEIVEFTTDTLSMTYLARGNTLNYARE